MYAPCFRAFPLRSLTYLDATLVALARWRTASLALAALTFASASLASTAVTEVNQLMAQGKLTEAAALAQAHLSRNGNDVHMRFLQGVIATEQQKYDLAIDIFSALTRDVPNLPEPYNNLAVLYATQGQMQKAAQTTAHTPRPDSARTTLQTTTKTAPSKPWSCSAKAING